MALVWSPVITDNQMDRGHQRKLPFSFRHWANSRPQGTSHVVSEMRVTLTIDFILSLTKTIKIHEKALNTHIYNLQVNYFFVLSERAFLDDFYILGISEKSSGDLKWKSQSEYVWLLLLTLTINKIYMNRHINTKGSIFWPSLHY